MCKNLQNTPELIDTLWNVNEEDNTPDRKLTLELIDTLWNVNDLLKDHFTLLRFELIDTLWNVNPPAIYKSCLFS